MWIPSSVKHVLMHLEDTSGFISLNVPKRGLEFHHTVFLFVFLTQNNRGLELSQRSISMPRYYTQLILMTFKTSCIDCKPRESLGHSNTDVSLISKMCFVVLELYKK